MIAKTNCLFLQGDAERIPLPDDSCALVLGSPPYCRARLYLEDGKDLGVARECREWVEWMMRVSREAVRVSKGLVLWVCAGPTEERNYQPGPEGLIWKWFEAGFQQECPCYWHRVGIPGSGGDQWFRKDVEYVIAFKKQAVLPFSDNTAMGHPPKWAPGGEMSHRVKDGERRNQWGKHLNCRTSQRKADGTFQKGDRPSHRKHTKRDADGEMREQHNAVPDLANPGNYLDLPEDEVGNTLDITVGGGHLGWAGAHGNEAPYPEALVEFFVRSFSRPGDLVLDVFSGSGTTCRVADRLGRSGIGMDLRMSQCRLGKQGVEHPHAPIVKATSKPKPSPLLDYLEAKE